MASRESNVKSGRWPKRANRIRSAVLVWCCLRRRPPPAVSVATIFRVNYLYKNETRHWPPPDGDPPLRAVRGSPQSVAGPGGRRPGRMLWGQHSGLCRRDLGYELETNPSGHCDRQSLSRRMGQAYETLAAQGRPRARRRSQRSSEPWLAEAARAAAFGKLLTGKLYIALDFLPASPRTAFDPSIRPLELPTVNGIIKNWKRISPDGEEG